MNQQQITTNITLLFTRLNKALENARKAKTEANPHKPLFTETDSTSASEDYHWLASIKKIRKWVGPRRLQKLQGHSHSIENEDWEDSITVKVNDIEDGKNLSSSIIQAQTFGQSIAEFSDDRVVELLEKGGTEPCYDGQPFFDPEHPVDTENGVELLSNTEDSGNGKYWYIGVFNDPIKPLLKQNRKKFSFDKDETKRFSDRVINFGIDGRYGFGYTLPALLVRSNLPLTAENYEAAKKKITDWIGADGSKLGLRPDTFIGGNSHEAAAKRLFTVANHGDTGDNIYFNELDVVILDKLN